MLFDKKKYIVLEYWRYIPTAGSFCYILFIFIFCILLLHGCAYKQYSNFSQTFICAYFSKNEHTDIFLSECPELKTFYWRLNQLQSHIIQQAGPLWTYLLSAPHFFSKIKDGSTLGSWLILYQTKAKVCLQAPVQCSFQPEAQTKFSSWKITQLLQRNHDIEMKISNYIIAR